MSEHGEHELHAGITAEIRARAGAWMDDKLKQYDERLADRLDAAHKREHGNAAKLREALRECAQYIACVAGCGVGEVTINDNVHLIPEELTQKAIAALSAPPRNCDRFGGDMDKLREACARERGLNPEEDFPDVFPGWLLAPATEKEGGAK